MNSIPLQLPFNIAGYQDKPYLSPPAFTMTYKMDLYKNPGVMMTNNSENNIDTALSAVMGNEVVAIISVSSTKVFIFEGTAIYVFNPFTNTTTTLGTAASEIVQNAYYFNGYIYFASATKLGRIDASTNAVTNAWAAFTQSPTVRPMVALDGVLYIGNGKYVALVDQTAAFVDNALDFRTDLSVRALYGRGNELYIGLSSTLETAECLAVRWNTWSESFSVETIIPEDDIISFISTGGRFFILTSSTYGARVYQYSEPDCVYYCSLPTTTVGVGVSIPHNAVAEWNGRTYIGLCGQSGSLGGVYSFGSPLPNGNPVFAYEYDMPGLASSFVTGIRVTAIGAAKNTIYWGFACYTGATNPRGVASIGTGRCSQWALQTSVLQMARGDMKLPQLLLYFSSKNANTTAIATVGDSYNSGQYTLLQNLPNQMWESDCFKESTNHSIYIAGSNGFADITGGEITFN